MDGTPIPPSAAEAPHEDDVKVAGGPRGRTANPAGDTLGFAAAEAAPLRTGAPRDEISAGRRDRGAKRSGGRTGLRIAAIAAGAAVVVGGGTVTAFALTGDSGDERPQTVRPSRPLADAEPPPVDPKVLEEQRRELALQRASREVRQDGGRAPALRPKGTPIPTRTPEKKQEESGGGGTAPVADPVPAGEAQQIAKKMMPQFGFAGDGEFGCLVKLWNKESNWNSRAKNPSSGAYGIPQALPGSKMATAGADWETNAATQIKWGLGYIKDRYATPCGAWSHSQAKGWY